MAPSSNASPGPYAARRDASVRSWLALACCAISLMLTTGCGARSQLIAPDTGVFPDVSDVPDIVEAGMVQPPIDPTCPDTCPYTHLIALFPPFRTLVPPDVPATCANGFELGGARGGCGGSTYVLRSTRPGGANAITLDVDFATYLAPDGVTVTSIDSTGARHTLLLSCRMQTSLVGGPSNMRPPDDTIRQFRLDVRAGTIELDFDFGAVTTPMYMKVLGLCDFDVTPFTHATFWRAVP